MIAFWIAAAVLSAAAAGLMLARGARALAAPGEDPAVAVHRRHLAEIDDLAERGLLAEAERKAARAEAGRRLLAAAERPGPAPSGEGAGRRATLAAAALTPLAAMGLYFAVGQPGMADAPYGTRLAEWRAADPGRLDAPRMAAVLEAIAAERPDDPEPLRNLALAELASGRPFGAVDALRKAVALAPERADLWAALGEAFVVQAEGAVGADARAAFGEALERDPRSATARYHLARAAIAQGEVAEGLAGWRALLADLEPGDPRAQALGAEIAQVRSAGGLGPVTPAQDEDMARQVRGMVEGLAARLEAAPDDPEGWVRLVRAWSVLGETDRRDAALARARGLFADRPEVLSALEAAAR